MAIIERFSAKSSRGDEITILVHVPSISSSWDAEASSRPELRTLVTSEGHLVTDCGCGCYLVEIEGNDPIFVSRFG